MKIKTFEITIDKSENLQTETISNFWKRFRYAIITFDTTTIFKMSQIPLSTHGDQDNDPKPRIERNDICKILNTFLKREVVYVGDTTFITNLEYIKITESLNNDINVEINSKWSRIGNLEFTKNKEGWKLSLLYLDTKSMTPN